MERPRTCGQGLAEHSALPAKLGELIAALAGNLEVHMTALDPRDKRARKERAAYRKLATELQRIADELEAIATQMDAYRDLPMGPHDEKVMSGPAVRRAFESFVGAEQELGDMLRKRLDTDRGMLAAMGRG